MDIVWWTSTFDHNAKVNRFRATTELSLENGNRLILLYGPAYNKNISLRRVWNHRQLGKEFESRLARVHERPDAIVVSYPTIELAQVAVRWGRANQVPVIVDVRDLWPDIFVGFVNPVVRPLAKLLLRGQFRQARYAFSNAAAIWGVSSNYRDFGLSYAGRHPEPFDGVIPIPVPRIDASRANMLGPKQTIAREKLISKGVDPTKRVFWFVGSFAKTYDLSTVIRAARSVTLSRRADVQFVFSGGGERDRDWRVEAEGLPNVVFTGWLDAEEVVAMGRMAYAGLQAYAAGAPQGLANKLPDYLRFGLPIIGSLEGENKEFLSSHECGISYSAGDPDTLIHAVLQLLGNPQRRDFMAGKAARAFEDVFELDVVCDQATSKINELTASVQRSGGVEQA